MTLPDFLVGQADGEIVLAGHRITLVDVLHFYADGESVEMIGARFPTVRRSVLHKVIAFYLDNRADCDAYVAQYEADLAAARAAGKVAPSADELRRRLAARGPAAATV